MLKNLIILLLASVLAFIAGVASTRYCPFVNKMISNGSCCGSQSKCCTSKLEKKSCCEKNGEIDCSCDGCFCKTANCSCNAKGYENCKCNNCPDKRTCDCDPALGCACSKGGLCQCILSCECLNKYGSCPGRRN